MLIFALLLAEVATFCKVVRRIVKILYRLSTYINVYMQYYSTLHNLGNEIANLQFLVLQSDHSLQYNLIGSTDVIVSV